MTTTKPDLSAIPSAAVHVDWSTAIGTSRTTLTTHLWTAPPLRRSSPIHDKAFDALRELHVDLARFLPWFSHPRIAVPALTPPTATETAGAVTVALAAGAEPPMLEQVGVKTAAESPVAVDETLTLDAHATAVVSY